MKRTGKKLAALFLSVLMVLSLSTGAFAAEAAPDSSVVAVEENLPDSSTVDGDDGLPADEDSSDSVPPAEDDSSEPVEEEPVIEDPAEEPAIEESADGVPDFVNEDEYSAFAGGLTVAQKAEKADMAGTSAYLARLQPGEDYRADEAVYLADTREEAEAVAAAYGALLTRYEERVAVIKLTSASVVEVMAAAEDAELEIPAVYPNLIYKLDEVAPASDDPGYKNQDFHTYLNTSEAWKKSTGAGVQVAVIDSGINSAHEDLKGNIAGAKTTVTGSIGGAKDNNGHGTHVSGIIAAKADNNKGGAGVAPDAKILSVKALEGSNGIGSTADISIAVNVAAGDPKTRVINMSLGGVMTNVGGTGDPVYKQVLMDATEAGVIVVAAAGNENEKLRDDYRSYPAYFNQEGVKNLLSVAATDASGNGKASFSNYGDSIDIAAPGTSIYSTWAGQSNAYYEASGTSMAAPMVSGVLALIISANPSLLEVRNKATADIAVEMLLNNTDGTVTTYGYKKASAAMPAAAVPTVGKPAISVSKHTDDTYVTGISTVNITPPAGTYEAVYYTMDGKTPTTLSPKYEGAFPITSGKGAMTIKAVAVYKGGKSEVVEEKITLISKVDSIKLTGAKGVSGVLAGKSLKITAAVTPAKPNNKTITWEILEADKAKGSVKSGTFTPNKTYFADKTAPETVTVVAKAADGYGATESFAVTVYPQTTDEVFHLSGITNKADMYYIAAGKSLQLDLAVNSGTNSKLVTWESSNNAVATVTASGKVVAAKSVPAASTTVTITAKPKKGTVESAKVNIVVYPATTKIVASAGTKLTMNVGDTEPMGASPNTGACTTLTYTSNKASVATVDGTGQIKAVAPGKATIKAIATDGTKKAVSISVTVVRPVKSLTIVNKADKSGVLPGYVSYVGVKKSITLTAVALPSNATNKKVTWSSATPAVATVSASGKVTGKATGETIIKATAKDGSGEQTSYLVRVIAPITSLSLSYLNSDGGYTSFTRNKYLDYVGSSYAINSNVKYQGDTKLYYTDLVNITSSNPYIASVSYLLEYNCWVIDFHNEGTVKITSQALDGTNKKHTVTFVVRK